MKTKSQILNMQNKQNENLYNNTIEYIDTISKTEIETILLSGSVARGDYFPGSMGGMIDLIVMKRSTCNITADEIFGINEDLNIPFHCVNRNGNWYQIDFIDYIDKSEFKSLREASKSAIMESQILFDRNNRFKNDLKEIIRFAHIEQVNEYDNCIKKISYLISDYKKDRWARREAYCQMHDNLNAAINLAINCIYYINGLYCPAEDRRLYYTIDLAKTPVDYYQCLIELKDQNISSLIDYERRENIFKTTILEYVLRNRPTNAST